LAPKIARLNLFYHLGIWLYCLIARLIAPFHTKAALFSKGHRGLIAKIRGQVAHDKPVVWFHCASLGEFEQGRPIIEGYRKRKPQHNILITFFSPSGFEVKKGDSIADWIFYFPLDTRRNVRRFLDTVQPVKAIFIKYEFWYNYLVALKKRNIPTYIVSATFRHSQPFFQWYGAFFRKMLHTFTLMFIQNWTSAELLDQIGCKNVVVAGDTRFDRVLTQAQLPFSSSIIDAFLSTSNAQNLCVAGSTWPEDEVLLFQALTAHASLRIILVPHEIKSSHIEQIMERFAPFSPVRYSRLSNPEMVSENTRVMVVDTIGLLSSLYRLGSMAYVGGGFGEGIHNILEAAVYGIPVFFGPRYQKFNEAVDLIRLGGAFSIRTDAELAAQIGIWLSAPQKCMEAGHICMEYVQSHSGATQIVLQHIQ
jgi:3-deoxy-D-manno-octulosonic-acid transferase